MYLLVLYDNEGLLYNLVLHLPTWINFNFSMDKLSHVQ